MAVSNCCSRKAGRQYMSGGKVHGREPEPLDEILDCLA
jgi:hypothetical protein